MQLRTKDLLAVKVKEKDSWNHPLLEPIGFGIQLHMDMGEEELKMILL